MPAILAPAEFERWLGAEADPRDLMRRPFDPNVMTMWPVSTRVNSPKNDNASLVEPVDINPSEAV
jgi:putative SOS response-associated peptidase YedK